MMRHVFVNPLNQCALLSDEATTPHCRTNCFFSVKLSCTSTVGFLNYTLGIRGISAPTKSATNVAIDEVLLWCHLA
jgi:hypothetical protein